MGAISARLRGPLLTAAVLICLFSLEKIGWFLPTPGMIFALLIVYSSFTGGTPAGLLSSVMAVLFSLFHFSLSGRLFEYEADRLIQLGVIAIGSPLIAILVGRLKRLSLQTARAEDERRFSRIVASIHDYGIVMLDPAGRVVSWNPGAEEIVGFTASEILGESFESLYPEEDRERGRPRWHLKEADRVGHYDDEGWKVRRNGSRFWANFLITSLSAASGEGAPGRSQAGYALVIRNMSERRQMEERLRLTNEELEARVEQRTRELREAIHARDEFLSVASHELRTPITSLKLQIDALLRELTKREFSRLAPNEAEASAGMARLMRSLRLSERQLARLTSLVEDLLDVSRIQAGKLRLHRERVDLATLAGEVLERFCGQTQGSGSKCQARLIAAGNVHGFWDRERLVQVLENLLTNALKYAPGEPVIVRVEAQGDAAVLSVQDFGPGIEKSRQSVIFERFERATASRGISGLGLGLFIVRQIAEAHGGQIGVDSEPGVGSKFTLRLPMSNASSAVNAA